MRAIWTSLLLIGAMLAGPAPGRAQDLPVPLMLVTSTEAFATPYGARLVEAFAAILEASADRACLAERRIAAPGRSEAAEWLTRYGQRLIDYVASRVDRQATLAAFVASSGAGAPAELAALARHPRVEEMIALSAPLRLDATVDIIAEQLDRYLLLERVRLARQLNPIAAGDVGLVAMRDQREQEANAALERYLAEHAAVPELRRYLDLFDAWQAARQVTADLTGAPHRMLQGIVSELHARCVGSAR